MRIIGQDSEDTVAKCQGLLDALGVVAGGAIAFSRLGAVAGFREPLPGPVPGLRLGGEKQILPLLPGRISLVDLVADPGEDPLRIGMNGPLGHDRQGAVLGQAAEGQGLA